ncbi:hypothetical protein [Xanthomonas phage RTH11]|nr:hypothetical protein [Xanthomonas phage RTH11]
MRNAKLPQISMEAIAIQRQSTFLLDIASLIDQLRMQPVIDQAVLDRSGLTELVKRRTGLNLQFVLNTPTGKVDHNVPAQYTTAAAEVPMLNPDSAYFKLMKNVVSPRAVSQLARFQYMLRGLGSLNGAIDLKTGRVSGVFSQIPCRVFLQDLILHARSRATSKQAAAVVIHEIGHVFSFFETVLHTTITNSVISTALDAMGEAKDPVIRVKLVTSALKAYGADESDAQVIAEAGSKDTQRILLLKSFEDAAQGRVQAAFGPQDTANYRSVEFVADQFAIRHGGAALLAQGLNLIFEHERTNYGVSPAKYYGVEAIRYGVLAASLCTPVWPAAAVVGVICAMVSAVQNKADDAVPSPLERMGAIKQDLVQLLKDMSLPTETRKQLLQDVEFVDTLRSEAKQYDSLARFVWKNLVPAGRQQTKIREFQKGLADMIDNDLFVHAARFRVMK